MIFNIVFKGKDNHAAGTASIECSSATSAAQLVKNSLSDRTITLFHEGSAHVHVLFLEALIGFDVAPANTSSGWKLLLPSSPETHSPTI